jgi:hypothetical protein
MAWRGGVPRLQRSSGGRGGRRRVLQLEEGTGEVRRGPKGADDRGVAAAVLGRALTREDERGKKRGCGGDGAPFIGDAARVRDGPWAAPRGGKAWGRGASAAVGRHSVADSGPTG